MERPKAPKSGISLRQGGHQVAQRLTIVSLASAKRASVTGSPVELRDEKAGKTSTAPADPAKTTADSADAHKTHLKNFFTVRNDISATTPIN
jgi:hypothetical protein